MMLLFTLSTLELRMACILYMDFLDFIELYGILGFLGFLGICYLIILSSRSSYAYSPYYQHDICYILYPIWGFPVRPLSLIITFYCSQYDVPQSNHISFYPRDALSLRYACSRDALLRDAFLSSLRCATPSL